MAASLVRIAHAYGNRRRRIEQALAAGVDLIEADLRYQDGRVWIRHELRVGRLPLLHNARLSGIHRQGPWALTLGPLFLRLDVRPIDLPELLRGVSGRAGLLLDLFNPVKIGLQTMTFTVLGQSLIFVRKFVAKGLLPITATFVASGPSRRSKKRPWTSGIPRAVK